MIKSFTDHLNEHREIGFVLRVNGIIAVVGGLPSVRVNELVIFEDNSLGEVLSFGSDGIEVMVFSKTQLKAKMRVSRTDRSLTVAVGDSLLGASIDPFGVPLNAGQYLRESSAQVPLKNEAWGIARRKRIGKPLRQE